MFARAGAHSRGISWWIELLTLRYRTICASTSTGSTGTDRRPQVTKILKMIPLTWLPLPIDSELAILACRRCAMMFWQMSMWLTERGQEKTWMVLSDGLKSCSDKESKRWWISIHLEYCHTGFDLDQWTRAIALQRLRDLLDSVVMRELDDVVGRYIFAI